MVVEGEGMERPMIGGRWMPRLVGRRDLTYNGCTGCKGRLERGGGKKWLEGRGGILWLVVLK